MSGVLAERVRSLLPKGRFIRNVAILSGGTAVGQGLLVLASPVLTRIYAPADFGLLGIYSAFLAILLVGACFRYELAIPLPERHDDAVPVLVLAFISVVFVSGLTLLAVAFFGGLISTLTAGSEIEPFLWILPLGVLGGGTYQALRYWAIRMRSFDRVAYTHVGRSTGQISTQIGLGLALGGPAGLIIGQVVGQAAGIGTLMRGRPAKLHGLLGRSRWGALKAAAARYHRFPLLSAPSAVLNTAGREFPVLLIAVLYGLSPAGWLALAHRIVRLPLGLVGTAVSQVYLGEAAEAMKSDPARVRSLFVRTAKMLFLLGLLPIGLLAIAGPWMFEVVFGPEWRQAGLYVRLLSLMLLAQFVASPLSQTLNILERQDLILAWDFGRFALTLGPIVAAGLLGFSDVHAITGYGLGMFLAYFVLFVTAFVVLNRVTNGTPAPAES